jgi:predicted RNA binding protein YcfA (HicA-like mRNA interferase family)
MPPLPIVSARQLISVLQTAGFEVVRQRGSHIRLKHPDGRAVTVPMHANRDIGRGLLRKILRDADISREEFVELRG